jgi:DNA-binding MarR family transcriptional regulator
MDTKDIRTLKILEEIEKDETPSQRDLAGKLNISLGLVNSFIKRLAKKGYFKVTNIPANRVRYMLTPKGAAEKTRLTYEYIKYSFSFYRDTRYQMRETMMNLKESGVQNIVLFGTAELAEIAYLTIQEADLRLVAIIDSGSVGLKKMGNTVQNPDVLPSMTYDKVILADIEKMSEQAEVLTSLGISQDKWVTLT